ncbi:glycoside hydrolase domain-containing protein [uncultured Clostridium sp.]|jgi:hypothetical protein|uniref:glycoside hydrolase domain-containing protein n=1 Tax=uncultured Clostridium sp. TaxID=59620 RepID=UPI0025FE5C30|nr:glycoside hydrolase domain-containing protein [uncultured Clostridium sp.]
MKNNKFKKFIAFTMVLTVAFTMILPTPFSKVFAAEDFVVVDDNVTDQSKENYFTYTSATDTTGLTGWASDKKDSILGDDASKTQHWVWNTNYAEASKHVYEFTFKGTGVELIGVKNDDYNNFQLDDGVVEKLEITGSANTPVTIYSKKNLNYGVHTVKVTLPENSTGLQVSYAKVYGSREGITEQTVISHTKTTGSNNFFKYSEKGWSLPGNSEHRWSDAPSSTLSASDIWYEVSFVGKKIDVYAGKNYPMGKVKYYIDDVFKGEYSLYNINNINSTLIATFDGLSDGPHKLKAVASGTKDASATNFLLDCSKVVVYHSPYSIKDITLPQSSFTLTNGTTQQIQYSANPDYIQLTDLTFTSANTAVATVDNNGLITAKGVGSTEITLRSNYYNVTKVINVIVNNAISNIGGSIVDTDSQYTQDRYNEVKDLGTVAKELAAWKNDKATSQIAVISKDTDLTNASIETTDLVSGNNTITKNNIKATFIKSTKAYNGTYLGYGSTTRTVPAATDTNRSESSDILYQTTPINIAANKIQPIWVEFAIPKDAVAGTYTTKIKVTAHGISTPLEFNYTIKVKDVTLPDASTFGNTFDIELWQYPYSSAEYYGVEAFSERHFELLKSNMEIYKSIGGHAITTTISEDAWSGQTYSKNTIHYPSMIKWTKNSNGSFTYDYTNFDKWVEFNKKMGIGDKIILYSIAPWHSSFTYWENGNLVKESFTAGTDRYNTVWRDFLQKTIEHLMAKGWFDDAYIGIDERGFSKAAFDLIDSVKNIHGKSLKTAGAMDHFVDKYDLALRVTDLNVGDSAAATNPVKFTQLVEAREALGYRTTLYSCTEHQPGNFSLSAPVESYWSVINAGEETSGFLRWAYDAWVADPLNDTTHNAFEPGDAFLIYPDEKNATNPTAKSSVRLERMAEGVRDVNKIKMILSEIPSLQSDVDAIYNKITTQAVISRNYLSADARTKLASEMNTFKADIDKLTDKYIQLKASGTNTVESIAITEGNSEVALGATKQLHAILKPDNLLNTAVEWKSSNTSVVSVNNSGVITGVKLGKATITVTSKQDRSKSKAIEVTVTAPKIEETARVAYYSFDNDNANTSWGTRNGTVNNVTFVEGKSGKAANVTATNNITLSGSSGIGENSSWTVSYWVKSSNAITDRTSVMMDSNKDFSFDLKMSTTNSAGFHVGKTAGSILTFNYTFQPNIWYNVAWTQSKTNGLSMYVNGSLVATNLWTKTNRILAPIDIIGGTGFAGLVDEVKVYNRELTLSEIKGDMLVKGLNLTENSKTISTEEKYEIMTNLITDSEDKTITYESSDSEVASVDNQGIVTGLKKGTATITVRSGSYTDTVSITVNKVINIKNVLTKLTLEEKYLSDIQKSPNTNEQYLGQPDMVRTSTGRLITAYPAGHGKGPIIMQISDNNGDTWTRLTNTPSSWTGSQETPTLYVLKLANGKERIMMITACPGWGTDSAGNRYGWNTSYSDDNGNTWTQYKHWHSQRADGANNDVIVGMASLVQLKDANGQYIQKWMGVYHTYGYVNYKTYLTFDEQGNEVWSKPEAYLSKYRSIESSYQMCEIGMFRSPDGKRIIGLARSQSHNNHATLIYSDDEGMTWSKPMDLPGSLAGERHKAAYDPISGRLLITFREIKYDLNNNGTFDGANDWTCGDWMAWVGTYDDLINQRDGQYCFTIDEDFAQNAKSGDTGYAGLVVLDDGTFIMDSYGHWDKEFSEAWGFGKVTTDLCYIKQAKFKLGEIENDNNLVSRDKLNALITQVKDTNTDSYASERVNVFKAALEKAQSISTDDFSQQVQVDAAEKALKDAFEKLSR